MKIAGLVKNSCVDYPGQLACVLFVPGCNYDCYYCHNRMLLGSAPEALSLQAAMAFLHKRAGLLDAVVITGGEPTLQPGLIPFLRAVKTAGYLLKLDTNGSMPDVVRQVLEAGLCDYFAVDYKAPENRYQEICGPGADARTVHKTIRLLLQFGADFEVRTTVIPQFSQGDLLQMALELPPVPRYVLNRYRKPDGYRPEDEFRVNQTPYTQTEVAAFAQAMRKAQPGITC